MPDPEPAAPVATPPAPAAQPTAPAAVADPELPDDEPMTTRTFSRLRNSYRTLQEDHKLLKAKVSDLETTSGQVNSLRQQLVNQAVVNQAHGLFVDPDDAAKYIDTDKIKVGADGKIDTKSIREQLEKVVEAKPHLKANGQARPGVSPARALPGGGAPRGSADAKDTARSQVNDAIRRAAGFGERE